MSNRTIRGAKAVHGTDPQFLVDKIVRKRIYDSAYWKKECFGLAAEDIVEKAESLKYFGGTYGSNTLPTPFLSLLLKMLQLQPDKDIINEFLNCEDMKYLQALAAFYIRLTANSQDIYELLEPFLSDFRKLRYFDSEKSMVFVYFDDFIDNLIREERFCGISMPVIQKRYVLEECDQLPPRKSKLLADIENYEVSSDSESDSQTIKKEEIEINKMSD